MDSARGMHADPIKIWADASIPLRGNGRGTDVGSNYEYWIRTLNPQASVLLMSPAARRRKSRMLAPWIYDRPKRGTLIQEWMQADWQLQASPCIKRLLTHHWDFQWVNANQMHPQFASRRAYPMMQWALHKNLLSSTQSWLSGTFLVQCKINQCQNRSMVETCFDLTHLGLDHGIKKRRKRSTMVCIHERSCFSQISQRRILETNYSRKGTIDEMMRLGLRSRCEIWWASACFQEH